jgi:hypothetical protein
MIFYMLICCFLYYVRNVTNNNAYIWYRIYRQSLQKEGQVMMLIVG